MLLHKRPTRTLKISRKIAQFHLRKGAILQLRVIIPSEKYSQSGFYKYVTYQPVIIKCSGKKSKIGSGIMGQPTLREINDLKNRFRSQVVSSQRKKFLRFCQWLYKSAFHTVMGFNQRQVAFIGDILTAAVHYQL